MDSSASPSSFASPFVTLEVVCAGDSLRGCARSTVSIAGVGGTVLDTLAGGTLGLTVGDFDCDWLPDSSTLVVVDNAPRAGCAGTTLGEAVEDALDAGTADETAGLAPGGGGRGAIPTPFLSLAAAAAAAEAYFRVSPGSLAGGGAGFIELDVDAEELFRCSVAKTGKGDFICADGLRAADDSAFAFDLGSWSSSWIDCVSCDETLSSFVVAKLPSSSPRFRSS